MAAVIEFMTQIMKLKGMVKKSWREPANQQAVFMAMGQMFRIKEGRQHHFHQPAICAVAVISTATKCRWKSLRVWYADAGRMAPAELAAPPAGRSSNENPGKRG